MLRVKLEPYELARAVDVGRERGEIRAARGHNAHYTQSWATGHRADQMQNAYDANIAASMAELAVAKAFGLYWHGHGGQLDINQVFRWFTPDVGSFIEVRTVTDPTLGPVISVDDYHKAHIWEQRTGQRMWVVSTYVPAATPGDLAEVWIAGGMDLQAGWELNAECCSHYQNGKPYRDRTRLCLHHLQERTHNWFADLQEAK